MKQSLGWWGVWLCALLVGGGCATSSSKKQQPPLSDEKRAAILLQGAGGAIQENDPTGALIILQQVEKIAPRHPGLFFYRGVALYMKHDVAAAIVAFKKGLALAPESADLNNTYGRIMLEQGNFSEARPALEKAANDPLFRESWKAKVSLGILCYKLGEWDKARDSLNGALAEEPNACLAYYYRGHLSMREGKFTAAARDYDQASKKVCANFAEAHLALGIAYERNREYTAAKKKFLDVRQIFPDTKVADQAMEHLRYLP